MPPLFNGVGFAIKREVRSSFCYHEMFGRVGMKVRFDFEPGPFLRSTTTEEDEVEASARDVKTAGQEKDPLKDEDGRNARKEIRIIGHPALGNIPKPEGHALGWLDFALNVDVGSQWTVGHDA